jgi:HK97 family phage portal protein
VYDGEGNIVADHHLTKLLRDPCKDLSKQDLIELTVAWLGLTGKAFWKKIKVSGRTVELFPITPDMIRPVSGKTSNKLIDGYTIKGVGGVFPDRVDPDYLAEDVIYFRFTDPANPLEGLAPLEVLAKTVDLDKMADDWKMYSMGNRGVPSGIVSFKENLTESRWNTVIERLKERALGITNARMPLVLGNEANYLKTDNTPLEMDFTQAGKDLRDRILAVYGIPLPIAGVSETMKYANYAESVKILWKTTIIPILNVLANKLNSSSGFKSELLPGQYISYDISKVAELSDSDDHIVSLAVPLWDMGVPFDRINQKFKLEIEPFEGSDKPYSGTKAPMPAIVPTSLRASSNAFIIHYDKQLRARDDNAENAGFTLYEKMLGGMEKLANKAVEDSTQLSFDDLVKEYMPKFQAYTVDVATKIAKMFNPVNRKFSDLQVRDMDFNINTKVTEYLNTEAVVLNDLSHMSQTTLSALLEQVQYGMAAGKTVQEINQAIKDLGLFGPERALMLSRTITGTAASIGQLVSGEESGMTHKVWVTSGGNVRPAHQARSGQTRGIKESFSGGAMYPLDSALPPADRVNCRCSMTFSN